MEELLARHRAERKDLQNKITSKKKNATKKTRKGVNDECETWEQELKTKQQTEIDHLQGDSVEQALSTLDLDGGAKGLLEDEKGEEVEQALTDQPKQVRFDEEIRGHEPILKDSERGKKPNRQKARLARRAAEQVAQANAAAEEAASLPDLREQEMSAMKKQQGRLGLVETFVQPDGHCLYSACAHGIFPDKGKPSGQAVVTYQDVRSTTASFISKHPNDFSAFLEEPLDSYVKKIKDTAEWGGQLELQAIARAYNTNINVLQADGRVEKIESDNKNSDTTEIWLAYYKHSFGLGEHYNALNPNRQD